MRPKLTYNKWNLTAADDDSLYLDSSTAASNTRAQRTLSLRLVPIGTKDQTAV